MRPRWWRPAVISAAWLACLGLILLCLWLPGADLREGEGSRADAARRSLGEQLAFPVANEDSDQLRLAIRSLQKNSQLGLVYLRVYRDSQTLVARSGRYESSSPRMREWLYGVLSKEMSVDLLHAGRVVGRVDYGLAWWHTEGDASAVQWISLVGLLVAVPGMLWLSFLLAWSLLSRGATSAGRSRGAVQQVPVTAAMPRQLAQPIHASADNAFTGEATLNALGIGVLTLDREERILQVNPAAAILLGSKPAQMLRQQFSTVADIVDPAGGKWRLPVAEVFSGRSLNEEEVSIRLGSGTPRNVRIAAWPVRDRTHAVQSLALMIRSTSSDSTIAATLREKLQLGSTAMSVMADAVLVFRPDGQVMFANAAAQQNFGGRSRSLEKSKAEQLFPKDLNSKQRWETVLSSSKAILRDLDGDAHAVSLHYADVPGTSDRLVVVRDAEQEQHYLTQAVRLERLLAHCAEEIFVFSAETLKFVEFSNSAESKLGYGPDRLRNMTLLDLSSKLSPDRLRSYMQELRDGRSREVYFQTRFKRENGSEYLVDVRLSYSPQETPPTYLLIALDPQQHLETTADMDDDRLLFLAFYDSLTGLPSRLLFMDRLQQALSNAQRVGKQVVVATLSVRGMAEVNRKLGYEAADRFLIVLANALRRGIGDVELVSRVGTDFLLMLPVDSDAAATDRIRQLHTVAAKTLMQGNVALHATISMGYTVFPEDTGQANALLLHAVTAASGNDSPDKPQKYQPSSAAEEKQAEDQQIRLRQALSMDHLGLQFWSIDTIRDNSVSGVLVGLEWSGVRGLDDDRERFAAAVQHSGLGPDLAVWLTRKVCDALVEWHNLGMETVPMIVDLSLLEPFRQETIVTMLDMFAQLETPLSQLNFAVSVAAFSENSRWVEQLRKAGAGLMVRAFSARDLVDQKTVLSADYVEIRPSASGPLTHSERAMAEAKANIAVARKMRATVLADVELGQESLQFLQALGCSHVIQRASPAASARQFGIELSRATVMPLAR